MARFALALFALFPLVLPLVSGRAITPALLGGDDAQSSLERRAPRRHHNGHGSSSSSSGGASSGGSSHYPWLAKTQCDTEPGIKDKFNCCNMPAADGDYTVNLHPIPAGTCYEEGDVIEFTWDIVKPGHSGNGVQSPGPAPVATIFPAVAWNDRKGDGVWFERSEILNGVCVSQGRATYTVTEDIFKKGYVPIPTWPKNKFASFSLALEMAYDPATEKLEGEQAYGLSVFPDPRHHPEQGFVIARNCDRWAKQGKGPIFGKGGSSASTDSADDLADSDTETPPGFNNREDKAKM